MDTDKVYVQWMDGWRREVITSLPYISTPPHHLIPLLFLLRLLQRMVIDTL